MDAQEQSAGNGIRILHRNQTKKDQKRVQSDAWIRESGIRRITVWSEKEKLQANVLYILPEEKKREFITSIESKIDELKKDELAGRNTGEGFFQVLLNQPAPDSLSEEELKQLEAYGITMTQVQSSYDSHVLSAIFTQLRSYLLEWDLNFMEGILKKRDPDELFIAINELIDRDFAIVNMDMQYVYCTDGYAMSRSLLENKKLPPSLFQDLVSDKHFHQVASEKGSFYFFTDSVERMNLCHNIFAGDQYIARIVLTLNTGEMQLPKGAEELFAIYAHHVQDMFTNNSVIREKIAKEQMDGLCRMLLKNQRVDPAKMKGVLEDFNWKTGDEFIAILLKFNTESGWDAQLYMMLPYLCSSLETEWPGCYTMHMDDEILLVLNCNNETYRSKNKQKVRDSILQKLAYFVRENTCKAGVSPVFTDFTQLKAAMDAAEAAYQIGLDTKPYLWYYLFDDIRLDYMVNSIKESLPQDLLEHPALRILKDYDKTHRSELNKTLYVYLKNNLNMTAASEELYIHRTSFCRRINQIKKLTELKLENPETVLTLLLSYQLDKE